MYPWIVNHPELMAAFVWPLVSAVIAAGIKWSTEHPKWHAVADVFAALGLDGPKAVDSMKRLFSTPAEAPKP